MKILNLLVIIIFLFNLNVSNAKDINLNSCLFIGDSKSDLQCANHFDMKFLFIKNEYNKHVIVDEDIPQVENFL